MTTEVECRLAEIKQYAARIGAEYHAGEIGFGRPCVGLRRGQCWLGYDPEEAAWPGSSAPDAYHKDNYIAVLIQGATTETAAILQLAGWLSRLDAAGYDATGPAPHPGYTTMTSLMGLREFRILRTKARAERAP